LRAARTYGRIPVSTDGYEKDITKSIGYAIARNKAYKNRISAIFKAVSENNNLVCEIEMVLGMHRLFGMHSIPYMIGFPPARE